MHGRIGLGTAVLVAALAGSVGMAVGRAQNARTEDAKTIRAHIESIFQATDIQYRVTDGSGKKVVERKDTIRTNFYSQGAGSTGTLAHPIAQKIAERIKDAKLK